MYDIDAESRKYVLISELAVTVAPPPVAPKTGRAPPRELVDAAIDRPPVEAQGERVGNEQKALPGAPHFAEEVPGGLRDATRGRHVGLGVGAASAAPLLASPEKDRGEPELGPPPHSGAAGHCARDGCAKCA